MQTADKQTPVIYVPGNHEYYGWEYDRLRKVYDEFEHPNVCLLAPGIFEFGDFVVIGATLRSALTLPGYRDYPLQAYENAISDFQVTPGWTGEKHVLSNRRDISFIIDALETYRDRRCIVVTHFVPTMQCIADFYRNDPLNPYFINDLDGIMDDYKPELWLFGHTHTPFDKLHSNGVTRLVCNPRGYPREKPKAYKWKEIECT